MEILLDPTVWAGLATLVVLEIVLGIDNLIFIAILSDKLPPHERQRARVVGLSLALGMRLLLLASISWMTTLTAPLFMLLGSEISGRDLIMFVGGGFLLFKATMELHEKLEGHHYKKTGPIHYSSFASVIAQIVILDAVFSLDAVITAVGMSNHLIVMMIAVCIAMAIMIIASNRLMNFVSAHPTVVILCLGFLLMIGFSLIIEGFDYHIPKGYLYAAIGFSVVIEGFNQLAQNNRRKNYEKIDPRTRVSRAVLALLGIKASDTPIQSELSVLATKDDDLTAFKPQERLMIQRVLQLSEQPVRAIMTPRNDLYWIDLEDKAENLEREIRDCPYSCLIVAQNGTIDEPTGVVLKKDLVGLLLDKKSTKEIQSIVKEPIFVPDVMTVLQTMDAFRKNRMHVAFVVDEFGALEGLVTLTDVVEAIAGDMPEDHDDEADRFTYEKKPDGSIILSGDLTIMELTEIIGEIELPEGDYSTVAGIALNALKRVPKKGDKFTLANWKITIEEMDVRRVSKMRFMNTERNEEAA